MKRFRAVAIAAALGLVAVFPAINAPSAEAHGWVTNPPSRQDNCATGKTSFDCGNIKYEPQSVEAPKGSMQCNGGGAAYTVLNDESKPWPYANVGSSINVQWKLTAAHATSLWEYFVDGKLHAKFDQGGKQPASNITHTLTNLPAGKHTILARWNVADTINAFYNCIDINVGGTTNPDPKPTPTEDPKPTPTEDPKPDPKPGQCAGTAWDAKKAYAGGDTVVKDGKSYVAKWWTLGDNPSASGAWGPWTDLGACAGDGDVKPTPTEDPKPTLTEDPKPTVTKTEDPKPDPKPGTCKGEAWSASKSYAGGATVVHNGRTYTAKWWTLGEDPSKSGAWGAWTDLGACDGDGDVKPTPTPTESEDPKPTPTDDETTPNPNPGTDGRVVGYFTNWGIYQRNYQVKDIVTSGSADKLTHILYAFGNVQNGKCTIGDSYADYEKAFTAQESVDGVADAWDDPLRGNFNQLRKLKQKYPNIKVLWSFGGWTWSSGFGDASKNADAFAKSCYDLVNKSEWKGVFDGIDIDWEYPNACGDKCDNSGFDSFPRLIKALRGQFKDQIVTAAITADASGGGKIDAADYKTAAQYLDFYMPMTYDYFGAWDKTGPTAPHSPLSSFNDKSANGYNSKATIAKLKAMGIPSNKLLLGLGFYGRGWNGVTDSKPGGSATGAAAGTYEAGIEDYKVLVKKCPPTGTYAGTAYAFCNGEWWSYDTPATIAGKMQYANQENLGGAFFWELSGDTANGELIKAIASNLK